MTGVHLAPEVASGLANLVIVVGDNKHWLGRWLSRWAVGAPSLEAGVAVAAIAQGQLGQSRAVLPFAASFMGHEVAPPDRRERRYNVSALDEPFDTWAQAVATLLMVDPALDVVLLGLERTQPELERRIGRVLEESRFYADFARGRLRELVLGWERGRKQVEDQLTPILVEMLCWFGPPGEEGVARLNEAGVLVLDNDGMRQRYLDEVAPALLELDLPVPVEGGPGGWRLTEELPWGRWNGLQRRL